MPSDDNPPAVPTWAVKAARAAFRHLEVSLVSDEEVQSLALAIAAHAPKVDALIASYWRSEGQPDVLYTTDGKPVMAMSWKFVIKEVAELAASLTPTEKHDATE